MECRRITSAFIRPDFLLHCLICGREQKTNETPFRRLRNGSGNEIEAQLADMVKNYVGVVVNQAFCCRYCCSALDVLENRSKRLKVKCKKAVRSVTFFVTQDADDDHNYHIGSNDKFVGSLISKDYENILPAEIIISNDYIDVDSIQIQETDSIVHEGHMCPKCNASFASNYKLRKHSFVHAEAEGKAFRQAEHAADKDLVPEKDASNMIRHRTNRHMSLRKNPRISVKSSFLNSSPSTCTKSNSKTKLAQSVSDEGVCKTESPDEVQTNSCASDKRTLNEIMSIFPDSYRAKESKIDDQLTAKARCRTSDQQVELSQSVLHEGLRKTTSPDEVQTSHWELVDFYPAKKSKIDDESTGGAQWHRSDHQLDLSQAMSDEEETPEGHEEDQTKSCALVRKTQHGIIIKTKIPDGSPAKKSKFDDQSTSGTQWLRSDHEEKLSQTVSDEEETSEGRWEDQTNSFASLSKTQHGIKSKFLDGSPAKESEIDDQSTAEAQCQTPYMYHEEELSQDVSDEEKEKPERCNEDIISVRSSDKSLEHVEALSKPKKPLVCSYCHCRFASSWKLTAHNEWHESLQWDWVGLEIDNSVVKPYQCELCGLKFSIHQELFRHMKNEHSDNENCPHKCMICNNIYKSYKNLRKHVQTHSSIKPFTCHCGKAFVLKKTLTRHKLIHIEKSHLCQFCGKLFTSRESLYNHTKSTHLNVGVKVQICDICGKGFEFKSLLIVHIRKKHNKKKDFLCDTCGYRFKHLRFLIRHRKKCAPHKSDEMVEEAGCKSDTNPYRYYVQCKACSRSFQGPAVLIDHITIFHERECLGCGESITSFTACRAHKEICSKRDEMKNEPLRQRLKAFILEDWNCEEDVSKSPVDTREMENANSGSKQPTFPIEVENQPFTTESLTNEEINLTESVKFQVDSNIFPTESVTDISSFINTSNIFHSIQSGDSGECVDPFQSEGQETLDGLLFTPNKNVEYEDGQIISSTELKNVTLVDPVLPTIEQDKTVELFSLETQ